MKDAVSGTVGAVKIDFHVHSCYSSDSLLRPENIIKMAKKKGLSGVAVVDHNTIKGGLETSSLVTASDNFVVIIGAEIRTDMGEIIGLFLKREIKSSGFSRVASEIKQQGGIVVLPHPYRTFVSLDNLENGVIDSIDLIEGFNARFKSNVLNLKAREFALKAGKPITGGSDAHFAHEIGNGVTIFGKIPLQPDAIRQALLAGKVEVAGNILPLPLYALYEFGIGRVLRLVRSLKRSGK